MSEMKQIGLDVEFFPNSFVVFIGICNIGIEILSILVLQMLLRTFIFISYT